jgi:TrmH family RNA methyltransferase
VKVISSKDNPTYKEIKKILTSSSYRKKTGLTIAIGKKIVDDIVTSTLSTDVKYIVLTDEKNAQLYEDFNPILLSPKLAKTLDDVMADQGIMAVIEKHYTSLETLPDRGPFLVLDGVSDPINVGTLIRTAVGLQYKAILVGEGTADPLSPKVIRSSAGYSLFIPIFKGRNKEIFKALKERTIKIITTYIHQENCKPTFNMKLDDFALCLGSEGRGLSDIWKEYPDTLNLLLKSSTIDSFNVAVAGSILMYILKTGGELCG